MNWRVPFACIAGAVIAALIAGTAVPTPGEDPRHGAEGFAALMRAPIDLPHGLAGMGFVAVPAGTDRTTLRVHPAMPDCSTLGEYAVRATGVALALAAPHRDSDRHTGDLVEFLFVETGARAAAWNTAPRRPSATCPDTVDLAREAEHPFTAFALAFADAYPGGSIVQLHGFDAARRYSEAGDAAAIVSNGTASPGVRVFDLADCLSLAFAPAPVMVYPGDARELGAVTNAQGEALRQAGFEGFAHLELSLAMREALMTDPALRARLAACLTDGAA